MDIGDITLVETLEGYTESVKLVSFQPQWKMVGQRVLG